MRWLRWFLFLSFIASAALALFVARELSGDADDMPSGPALLEMDKSLKKLSSGVGTEVWLINGSGMPLPSCSVRYQSTETPFPGMTGFQTLGYGFDADATLLFKEPYAGPIRLECLICKRPDGEQEYLLNAELAEGSLTCFEIDAGREIRVKPRFARK